MVGIVYSSGSTPAYRSLMIFIDGAYFEKCFNGLFPDERVNYLNLSGQLVTQVGNQIPGLITPELIRIYYYDAIVDPGGEKYKEQRKKFDEIRETPNYEIRLGRLIKSGNKNKIYRQKGVDILLAIDMLSKAYLNHYDMALLLAGDDDYLDLVKTVKDITGKRIFGAYFPQNTSDRLLKSFDRRIEITDEILHHCKL
jgi:uncharacterized LabA/DUF88 family protein